MVGVILPNCPEAAVLRPGFSLVPEELVAWCERRMARHMVSRYFEFLSELPLTPTEKVEKFREAGITAETWDREGVRR